MNDDDYEEKQKGEFKDQNKCGRRVSIQFNGKPLEKQHETMPSNSNDCDANCTDCDIEEPIAITPTSFRLRRASCNRKFSDESFGSLLYPPSSFFGYKRGKKSFLSSVSYIWLFNEFDQILSARFLDTFRHLAQEDIQTQD